MESVKELGVNMLEKILSITPKQLIIGLLSTWTIYRTGKMLRNSYLSYKINKKYREKALKFRKERDEKLKKFYDENNHLFSDNEKLEIRLASLSDLKGFLDQGKYTSEKIAKVLLLRNYEFLQYNYAADVNVEETLKLAKAADELRAKINQSINKEEELQKYPLLGLPLSIKDVFKVQNFYLTQGYAANLDLPINSTDSYIVEILKQKGAVPLIMSSVPQGIYAMDTDNLIFGQAQNPFNRECTTGGSSGGEAGLIRTLCSPAGIGSDIGGSLRIPAAFCGIYSFKPTSTRTSKKNTLEFDNNPIKSGFAPVVSVSLGPLARTMKDIILLSRNILGNFEKDHYCNHLPYDTKPITKTKFKIGVFSSAVVKLTQPVEETVNLVAEELKNNKTRLRVFSRKSPFQ